MRTRRSRPFRMKQQPPGMKNLRLPKLIGVTPASKKHVPTHLLCADILSWMSWLRRTEQEIRNYFASGGKQMGQASQRGAVRDTLCATLDGSADTLAESPRTHSRRK